MAKKRAIDKTLPQWLIPQLRNIARTWPQKQLARDRAKVSVQIGFYKNGKPEFRTMYKCAMCGDNFLKEETQADHIEAVVDPENGFVDWNTFMERLFCDSHGYQILCKSDHLAKTFIENDERKEKRKKVKNSVDKDTK